MSRNKIPKRADELDLEQLTDQIIKQMGGRPVTTLLHTDELGNAEIELFDPDTGSEIEIDATNLANLVNALVVREPIPDPLDRLELALTGATTIAKLRDALSEYVAGERKLRGPQTLSRNLNKVEIKVEHLRVEQSPNVPPKPV